MNTFVEILRDRAQNEPDLCAFAFLTNEGAETRLTYAQLDERARGVAAVLQRVGAAGERVLVVLEPGLDYVVALFGCILAGSTLVPCALPRRVERASQLRAITLDSRAKFALGCSPFAEGAESPPLQWIPMDASYVEEAGCWREPSSHPDHIALLQYTSGSTASPKGVMVSHANLLANARAIAEGFEHPRRAWGVTWLPPYHDMGLMGGILQPVYCCGPSVVISPMDFIRRPALWLEAVSRYRARTSGGPNFAYELCARSMTPTEDSDLQLDGWELAYIGAEPVRADTVALFSKKFAPFGFRRESFFPCYGLAEATLYVSGGRPGVRHLSAAALREHRVIEEPEKDADIRPIVSCGRPASSLKVSIVNPETGLPCEPNSIGEIWVSGPTVACGYWNRPEETHGTFQARLPGDQEESFLRTGDLGFMRNGELFVTGRSKDLMIIRGRNHYPQDVEDTVAGVSRDIRPGACAVFSVDSGREEKVVLILEMPRPRPEKLDVLAGDIRQAVAGTHELQLSSIVLVRPSAIPRTSSGKVQRLECRARYESGALQPLAAL